MADFYGYREGAQVLVNLPVDSSTAAITKGDALTWGTAGYVQQAAAGDVVCGFAEESCAAPSADGGASILVDVSTSAIYEFPPDAGTVTQALVGKTCDLGGPRSVNIDASDDDTLQIVRVDANTNTLFVQRVAVLSGVV